MFYLGLGTGLLLGATFGFLLMGIIVGGNNGKLK